MSSASTLHADWCPTCSESYPDHATMCTICGDSLVRRPVVAAIGVDFGRSSDNGDFSSISSFSSDSNRQAREGGGRDERNMTETTTTTRTTETTTTRARARTNTGTSRTDTTNDWMYASLEEAGEALSALRQSGELDGMTDAPDVAAMESRLAELAARLADASGVRRGVGGGGGGGGGNSEGWEWQVPPAEAMDPSGGRHDRPTSKKCLDLLPRIVVDERSSILHECTVTLLPPPALDAAGSHANREGGREGRGGLVRRKALEFNAVVAEFGPAPPYSVTGRLVLVSPPTCRGGLLSKETVRSLSSSTYSSSTTSSTGGGKTIAFVERGGGITFAKKALLVQDAGASAVVVAQNIGVWPYVMRDSSNEAGGGTADSDPSVGAAGAAQTRNALRIPVVMVKRSDGDRLRRLVRESGPNSSVRCTVAAAPSSLSSSSSSGHGDCVVCRELFRPGNVVVRLPTCGHCFHETCALIWLCAHNTCPYCRWELPTDDEEYEKERRRRRRSTRAGNSGLDGMGRSGDNANHWETIFG